ncbi:MAG: response regulator [Bacteroidetes bacterium]|nr:response regulator [Bacteroidota bacterium]
MNVLLIDDDDAHRVFLRQAFSKKLNATVMEAKNGVEALRVLEKLVPDVIMLDLWMPVMNGQDFLEKLRIEERWKDIPVIIMSALRDKDIVQKLLKLKISDYMVKPITVEQLTDRISKISADTVLPQ